MDKLDNCFLPEDKEAIMSIPFSTNETSNRLIWAENKSGKFISCEDSNPGLLEQFITICWGIWKNWNELRTGGKGKAGRMIMKQAIHLGNVLAHVLAQHAKNVQDYIVWLENCPSIVEHVCAQDRM
ncbi:hypothetical protein CFP56_016833 [Quercus suber]|uniref:Uncharacterized protein n=1 Tax=Quercus suber TaxID=58331 RepID=A0AAW0KPH8_QUESU